MNKRSAIFIFCKKTLPIFIGLSILSPEILANDTKLEAAYLEEIVVTATKTDSPLLKVPYSVDLIDIKQINERSYRTLPQLLRDTPGIMV